MSGHRPPVGGAVRHADDWLMTYADTITLLLCLFVVLLALHGTKPHSTANGVERAPVAAAVASTLPTAIVFAPPPELAGMPRTSEATDDDPDDWPAHPAIPPTRQALPPAEEASAQPAQVVASATAAAASPDPVRLADDAPEAPPSASSDPVGHAATALHTVAADQVADPPPHAAPPPRGGAIAAPEPGGDRITIFQFSSAAFFASGSATLSDAGRAILGGLLDKLQSPRFAAYRITVQGHTDDEPISSVQFPSNWELSAARAAAVVRFFVEHGIPAQNLRAAGYADTHPLAPDRDAAGNPIPENQAKNRRVVIELEKIDHAGT